MPDVPEIDLADPEVVRDPYTAYGAVRERAPLARVLAPGVGTIWTVTRYDDTRTMLADPRLEMTEQSFLRPAVPADCVPYLRTMAERNGQEHARLRRLVAPAFTARRADGFRTRIEPIAARLLDELPELATDGSVDLLRQFAWRLPMEVICELVGVPAGDRPRWREYGATVAAGAGPAFAAAIPRILADVKQLVARRDEHGDDLIGLLVRVSDADDDRLDEVELVTLVWHLLLAGQTPANLVANAVAALFLHPAQLATVRADDALMPAAVDELTRWRGPTMLAIPRYAREDVELHGVRVKEGEPVSAAVVAANRDPRAYPDPERLDVTRPVGRSPHLGYGHGPHFCLGAALARTQTEVALTMLFRRFPDLRLAVDPANVDRVPDPGTWRLAALPVVLQP